MWKQVLQEVESSFGGHFGITVIKSKWKGENLWVVAKVNWKRIFHFLASLDVGGVRCSKESGARDPERAVEMKGVCQAESMAEMLSHVIVIV